MAGALLCGIMRGMETDDADKLKYWVECWRNAGPRLEALRREAIRNADTTQGLLNLAGAFRSALLYHTPAPTSGLVEQQAWFKKIAEKQRSRE